MNLPEPPFSNTINELIFKGITAYDGVVELTRTLFGGVPVSLTKDDFYP